MHMPIFLRLKERKNSLPKYPSVLLYEDYEDLFFFIRKEGDISFFILLPLFILQ